jgi:NADH-quinone oxidoreductase subunit L
MAAITLAVPIVILVTAHWLVSQDYFQKQSAIVLLFFGWITGAQLIFATYRMRTENLRRLITLSIFSFAVVVLGYTLISHAFDLFLYPDPAYREQLYSAADIDLFWFDVMMVLISLVIIFGWVITYFTNQNGNRRSRFANRLWLTFYALVSREFYIADIYARLTRSLLSVAGRLNLWLRWV